MLVSMYGHIPCQWFPHTVFSLCRLFLTSDNLLQCFSRSPRPSLIANELSVDDLKKIECFFRYLFFRIRWMCCTVTLVFWFFRKRVSSLLNVCSVYVLQWYSHPGSVICLLWSFLAVLAENRQYSSSTENLK